MSKNMKEISCSFCGRRKSEVTILVAGVNGHICGECAAQATQIVNHETQVARSASPVSSEDLKVMKPAEIK
jgi:ATP-dependent Clp protease ATP-binding subunit ClpX